MNKKLFWKAVKEEALLFLIAIVGTVLLLLTGTAVSGLVVTLFPTLTIEAVSSTVIFIMGASILVVAMGISIKHNYDKKIQDKTWKK